MVLKKQEKSLCEESIAIADKFGFFDYKTDYFRNTF